MRARVSWTVALDEQLRALRVAGMTWDEVAAAMSMGRNTALERGRRIGARGPRRPLRLRDEDEADRPARPPGHPDTWGLITSGTLLEGTPYPFPVFL